MDSPDTWSEVFAVYLDNVRWMIEETRGRIDGLHQRASYILASTGVILAILPTVIDPVRGTKGWFLRDLCWVSLVAVVVLLAAAAIYSALAMFVHEILEVPGRELQSQWIKWTDDVDQKPDSSQVIADYANALFGREPTLEASPLLSLMADADKRARLLRMSMWLAVADHIPMKFNQDGCHRSNTSSTHH